MFNIKRKIELLLAYKVVTISEEKLSKATLSWPEFKKKSKTLDKLLMTKLILIKNLRIPKYQ